MLQPRLWMRLLAVVAALTAAACKTRDPDSAGLLDTEPDSSDNVDQGSVQITCTPAPTAEGELLGVRYIFSVAGATSATDESQAVLVTVERERLGTGQRESLSSDEAGRGAVAELGAIFIGFPSGVLTANYGQASTQPATHGGVLTLSTDADASAITVNCDVVRQGKN